MLVTDASTLRAIEAAYPAATLADGAFDWSDAPSSQQPPEHGDAFQRDVLGIARKYFLAEAARRGVSFRDATKATPARWAQVFLLAALAAAWFIALLSGWWTAVVLCPLCVWLLQVNNWHDASHFALSTDARVNAALLHAQPWLVSGWDWNHQHIIGHHSYPNIPGLDPDLYHVQNIWRLDDASEWLPAHGKQASIPWLATVWFFAVPVLSTLYSHLNCSRRTTNAVVQMRGVTAAGVVANALRAAAMLACVVGWPWLAFPGGQPWKALVFGVVPWCIFSVLFMVASQVNHHSPGTSHYRSTNWYRHQCGTAHNIAPQSRLLFLLMGGLNLQNEHHLLPGVNHCHLAALQPAIAACAARHGVPYQTSPSLLHALGLLVDHLKVMGVKPSGHGGLGHVAASSKAVGPKALA